MKNNFNRFYLLFFITHFYFSSFSLGAPPADCNPIGPHEKSPLLDESHLTEEEKKTLKASRSEFLKKDEILESPYYDTSVYSRGIARNAEGTPRAPLIHPYHFLSPRVPLAVKLPHSFNKNIPKKIKEKLSSFHIEQVDLFWILQYHSGLGLATDGAPSLKPAYWVYGDRLPDIFTPETLRGSLPEYQVCMGVYESNQEIQDQVPMNDLNFFSVVAHDGKISPDTGHLELGASTSRPHFSFFSLVIIPAEKRAAVTWHVLLSSQEELPFDTTLASSRSIQGVFENLSETLRLELFGHFSSYFSIE